jgi:23S rRNA pseudouridine955/2504/2580 synthase
MQKLDRTVVYGAPPKNEDTLCDFLYKDTKENRVYIFPYKKSAKQSMNIKYDDDIKTVITKYKVLKKTPEKSLLEIDLITGRTHQIRAHLAYIGCPIVGDGKYGKNHKSKTNQKYQLLCSHKLKFDFRNNADILQYLDKMEFESKRDVQL